MPSGLTRKLHRLRSWQNCNNNALPSCPPRSTTRMLIYELNFNFAPNFFHQQRPSCFCFRSLPVLIIQTFLLSACTTASAPCTVYYRSSISISLVFFFFRKRRVDNSRIYPERIPNIVAGNKQIFPSDPLYDISMQIVK